MRFIHSAILFFFFSCGFAQDYQVIATGGKAYRLYVISDSLTANEIEHQKDLKPGSSYGFDFVRMEGSSGWGISYSTFRGKKSSYFEEGSRTDIAPSYDQIIVNFYSLNYYLRKSIYREKLFLNGKVGLGYVTYENNTRLVGEEYSITSDTYGISVYFGVNYNITKHILIGTNTGLFTSKIEKIKVNGNEQTLSTKLGLTRVELNICLGYIF